uniref:Uncharacterized protein n=1 Tax=Cacopsylla melanoneura TaxID=428564 RepID=A0A8D8YBH2_9HEMI
MCTTKLRMRGCILPGPVYPKRKTICLKLLRLDRKLTTLPPIPMQTWISGSPPSTSVVNLPTVLPRAVALTLPLPVVLSLILLALQAGNRLVPDLCTLATHRGNFLHYLQLP